MKKRKRQKISASKIAAIVAAYHGPKSAADLARDFNIKGGEVRIRKIWARAKDAGDIVGAREFQIVTDETDTPIADTSDATFERDADDELDDVLGPPIASPWGIRLPDPDPLVMALVDAFGADYRPPCVAEKLLDWEKDSGTIHEPGEVISAEDAMIMASAYDRLTRERGAHSPEIDYEVGEIVLLARKARKDQARRATRGI